MSVSKLVADIKLQLNQYASRSSCGFWQKCFPSAPVVVVVVVPPSAEAFQCARHTPHRVTTLELTRGSFHIYMCISDSKK